MLSMWTTCKSAHHLSLDLMDDFFFFFFFWTLGEPYTDHLVPRASVLFRFNSVFLVAELVSNPLGGFLLNINPWLSLIVGNICMILAFSGFYFLPETLVVRRWHDAKTGRPSLSPSLATQDDGSLKRKSRVQFIVDAGQAQLRQVWDFLITNKRIAILILPFVCVSLGRYIQELLLQYATKRYGWSWSKVRTHVLCS